MSEAVPSLLVLGLSLLATGAVAGVTAGLLGVGGGIVIVPILFTAFEALGIPLEIRMHLAVGTSLATIIPTSVASLASHHKKGAVDWPLFKTWLPWIFIGCAVGTAVANILMNGAELTVVFGLIAALVAIDLIVRSFKKKTQISGLPGVPPWLYRVRVFPVPTTIGFFSSMMGIGGGTLSVPFLNALRFPIHKAVATSAGFGLVIAIPAALGYVLGGWDVPNRPAGSLGYVSIYGATLITVTSVFSAPLGARAAHALSEKALRLLFAGFLALTAIRMLTTGQ